MAKVVLENITKNYGKTETIKDTSITIDDNDFIVLVGPSGCGKSTILRMIAGLEDITSGNIYIGEKLVNDVAPKDRNIAMVFQNYALYPHKNIYENMAFGLKMRNFPKEEIDKRVKNAAEILHITEYLDRKPKQLSGGQRQRVALGRAIVRDPDVFLMDEPLSNLDAKLRVQMRAELRKLHNDLKTTFIYVTHDQVEAMTMGDRIVILNEGIVQQVDTPKNIYDTPNNIFVASFMGSPPMNFLKGKIDKDSMFHISNISFKISSELFEIANSKGYIDKDVYLGIRPEYFCIDPSFEAKITIKANLVEMLGSEKLVHFSLNESNITAKVEPDFEVTDNKEFTLSINLEKAVLFDLDSKERIKT